MASFGCNIGANDEVLGEFREVPVIVPKVDIGACVNERGRGVADCFPVLLKLKDAVVNVVAVVHWDVAVRRLGAPHLAWDVDYKSWDSRWGAGRRSGKTRGRGFREAGRRG